MQIAVEHELLFIEYKNTTRRKTYVYPLYNLKTYFFHIVMKIALFLDNVQNKYHRLEIGQQKLILTEVINYTSRCLHKNMCSHIAIFTSFLSFLYSTLPK